MGVTESAAYGLRLIGGRLCLDFVNTVGGRKTDRKLKPSHPEYGLVLADKLNSYADLVAWGHHAGVLNEAEARLLLREAKKNPGDAERIFSRAIMLREALYRLLKARISGSRPLSADLDILNEALSASRSQQHLMMEGDRFVWKWMGSQPSLAVILWQVASSAAEFLTGGDLTRLSDCGGENCGWLFEDTSRNRSRQWCYMEACGNLAKVRRFRNRIRRGKKSSKR